MISKEEVKHIAKLARLGLTEKETEKLQGELSSVLDYIEKLKEIDILGVEPTSHSVLVENIKREDKPETSNNKAQMPKKLLDLTPNKKERYLKVKSIL